MRVKKVLERMAIGDKVTITPSVAPTEKCR